MNDSPIQRKTFLRGVLGVLGAGVGLTATAGASQALPPLMTTCCRVTQGCPTCEGVPERYRCNSECTGGSWCVCSSAGTNCYSFAC